MGGKYHSFPSQIIGAIRDVHFISNKHGIQCRAKNFKVSSSLPILKLFNLILTSGTNFRV